MKKGRIVNVNQLPKVTIEDQQGKVRSVELAGVIIPELNQLQGNLGIHSILRKYRCQPIEYQLSKTNGKMRVRIPKQSKELIQILVEDGGAELDLVGASSSKLFSAEELQIFQSIKCGLQPEISNFIHCNSDIKKQNIAIPGSYELISLGVQMVLARGNAYISVSPTNIELCCLEIDPGTIDKFVGHNLVVDVVQFKITRCLISKKYKLEATFKTEFELSLLREGLGKVSLKAAVHLPKDVYDQAETLSSEAANTYKGLWKSAVDIFSLIYAKSNFLAKVIEVIEGNIYRIKNMIDDKIMTVELSRVQCPIRQETGAFEARDFARREFIGKLVNVYVTKQSQYNVQGDLVLLDIREHIDKILVVQGWGTVKSDLKNDIEVCRLHQYAEKAFEEKTGLHSVAKKKVGITRYEDLTSINSKQMIERSKEFSQIIFKNTNVCILNHYSVGVIEGFKQNDIFKVRLSSKRVIINVKIEGVKALQSKIVVTELKAFKENSHNYLVQNFLQRDIQVRLFEFDLETESFVGEIMLEKTNMAETLLENGLVFIDDSSYVPQVFHQQQEKAKAAGKGVWSPFLLRLRKDKSQKLDQLYFNAQIAWTMNGNGVYYRTPQSRSKLDKLIAPAVATLQTPLNKQLIKIGNICAAPFDGQLYRARITSYYGNTGEADKASLVVVPEQLMVVQELATRGQLAFMKKLKGNYQNFDVIDEDIQRLLLQKDFNIQIVDDQLLLFEPDVKHGHVLDSVNVKMLHNGLLKLDKKGLSNLDQTVRQELISVEKQSRGKRLGVWLGYQSDSDSGGEPKYVIGDKTAGSRWG